MHNKFIIMFFSLFCFAILINTNTVEAYSYSSEITYRLDKEEDCEGILGDPKKDGTFANMLQGIFNIMRYLAPILCLVLSTMDFLKAAASQDKEGLKKAFKTTGKRLVFTLIIFLLPTLINFLFELLGWYGTCGIE